LTREEKLNRLQQQQNEEPTSSGAPHNAVSAGEYFSSYVPLESSRSPVPPESSSVAPSEASTREARAFAREDARIRLNKGIKTQLRTGVFSPAPGASPRAAEPAAAQRRLVVPASRALVDAVERGALPSLFGPTAAAEASGAAYRDPYADDDGDDDGFGAGPDRVLSTPAKGGKRQQKKVKTVPRAPVCPAEAAAAAAAAAAASDAAAAAEAEDGALNWFPGHMAKAVQTMAERLRDVQLVIEVRDARCPLSSANPLLDRVAAGRPRVVVLNKADLALGRGAASSAAAGGVRRRAQSLLTRVARRLDTQLDAQRGTGAAGPQRPAPHWQAQLDACGGDAAREAALLRLPDGPAASADEAKRYEAVLTREDSRARARMLRDQRATNPASATVPGADAEARRSSVAASSSVKASARGWCPYEVLLGGRGAVVLTDSLSSVLAPRTILALVQRLAPPRKFSSVPTAVLVCGFPNVGKSTIINSLRRSAIVTGAYRYGSRHSFFSSSHSFCLASLSSCILSS
jgi:Tfp pilus assembly major pilin PilA